MHAARCSSVSVTRLGSTSGGGSTWLCLCSSADRVHQSADHAPPSRRRLFPVYHALRNVFILTSGVKEADGEK